MAAKFDPVTGKIIQPPPGSPQDYIVSPFDTSESARNFQWGQSEQSTAPAPTIGAPPPFNLSPLIPLVARPPLKPQPSLVPGQVGLPPAYNDLSTLFPGSGTGLGRPRPNQMAGPFGGSFDPQTMALRKNMLATQSGLSPRMS